MGDVIQLPGTKQIMVPPGPAGRWSPEQDAYIAQMYGSDRAWLPLEYIARAVGRTPAAVRHRLHKLGVCRSERFLTTEQALSRRKV